LKQLCTVNNANLGFHDLLSAWVESSIGSVIGFMTSLLLEALVLAFLTTLNINTAAVETVE